MHTLTITKDLDLGQNLGVLTPGDYLFDDRNSGKLLAMHDGVELTRYECETWAGREILITGGGAYGDLLLLTPVIAALQAARCTLVAVACFKQYADVLADVCETVPYPTPRGMLSRYDSILTLERAWEEPYASSDKHLTDVFAEVLGVELNDRKPVYTVTEEERSGFANQRYPRIGKKRIGVQVNASTRSRTYPHIVSVVADLHAKGHEIVILGAPNEVPLTPEPGLINCTADKLTFRQSVAVLATCDAFVGPDSALIHYAGALDVPAIGLYGPFHWKQRTAYAPTTTAIQGCKDCDKAPCHFHGRPGQAFPKDAPCTSKGYCTALASIDPNRVVAKVEGLLAKP